jgi:hypothetical protein
MRFCLCLAFTLSAQQFQGVTKWDRLLVFGRECLLPGENGDDGEDEDVEGEWGTEVDLGQLS